ncbi:MAG: carboxypeptidase-like regulatory domain-containing protein, partial [Vicinamibacterales bacterium]
MVVTRRFARLCTAVVLLVVASAGASAQILTGSVVGTVQDAQGGVIPGATVTLVSDTRATRSVPVQTSASGDFVVANVTAGTYTVEVTMPSFKTLQRSGVQVSAGERAAVGTLVIDIGAASETVEVKADKVTVQSTSGERSFATDSSQIENLPLNGRSYAALTAFTPGVTGGTNGGQPTRLGGGGANNTMMDGVSTMDTGNNAPLLPLNVEAIAEVKVLTSNYQAEYGRASGLQITAVTKSGSNEFRGSTYAIRRDSSWDSTSWLNRSNGQPK